MAIGWFVKQNFTTKWPSFRFLELSNISFPALASISSKVSSLCHLHSAVLSLIYLKMVKLNNYAGRRKPECFIPLPMLFAPFIPMVSFIVILNHKMSLLIITTTSMSLIFVFQDLFLLVVNLEKDHSQRSSELLLTWLLSYLKGMVVMIFLLMFSVLACLFGKLYRIQ